MGTCCSPPERVTCRKPNIALTRLSPPAKLLLTLSKQTWVQCEVEIFLLSSFEISSSKSHEESEIRMVETALS